MNGERTPDGRGSRRDGSAEARDLLIDAFTKVAAERGYEKTEVRDVAVAAGFPGSAFYAHFSDKRQCLLAAYDRFFDRLIEEIEDVMDQREPWPRQVERGIDAALGFVLESKGAARLFAVEALALGPLVLDRYGAAVQRIAVLLRRGRQHSAVAAGLPPLTEAVLVAGVVSLVVAALLAEDAAQIAALEPQLTEALLFPYVGPAQSHELTA